ncbi:MAG: putative metal-binding motif-containing protein, partial [Polyangia bacterium]|nr:putative metal-binding motif-containing protein [Polyangia bacterium]
MTLRGPATRLVFLSLLLGWGCGPRQSAGDDGGINNNGSDAVVTPDVFVSDPFTDDDGDGYSEVQGDCDDNNPLVHPFAAEICGDGIDNDCNGYVDGYEPDKDGDGFGPCQGDCVDDNPAVSPIAEEVPDGIDNNCDGIVDGDYDGDGFTVSGGDCDDHNPLVFPGAVEH